MSLALSTDTVDEIKTVFLSISQNNRCGYFISLYDTLKWLDVDMNPDKVKFLIYNIKTRYLRKKEYYFEEAADANDFSKDYHIIKDSKRRNVPYFSDEGFKKFCMVYISPKSNAVRMYYINLERDFLQALCSTQDQNAKIMLKLTNDFEDLSKKYKKTDQALLLTQKEASKERLMRIKHEESLFYQNDVIKKYNYLDEYDKQEEYIGNDDYKIYKIIEKSFLKPVYIYIISCEYMSMKYNNKNTKNNILCTKTSRVSHNFDSDTHSGINVEIASDSDSNSDIKCDYKISNKKADSFDIGVSKPKRGPHNKTLFYDNSLSYDYIDDVNIYREGDKNETYYFMLMYNKKYDDRKIAILFDVMYVINKNHYNDIINNLRHDKKSITPIKKIFAVSYSDINNHKNRILINYKISHIA
jgi:hypothetical protein